MSASHFQLCWSVNEKVIRTTNFRQKLLAAERSLFPEHGWERNTLRCMCRAMEIKDSAAAIDSPSTVILSTVGLTFCPDSVPFPLRHSTCRDEIFTGKIRIQRVQKCFAYECWYIDCRARRWNECWSFPPVILWFPFTSRVRSPSGPPMRKQKTDLKARFFVFFYADFRPKMDMFSSYAPRVQWMAVFYRDRDSTHLFYVSNTPP